jgi:hypothetical protein
VIYYSVQPTKFPEIIVQISNATYDYVMDLSEGSMEIEISNDITDSTVLYVTVVCAGSFDAVTSAPLHAPDISFLLAVQLVGEYFNSVFLLVIWNKIQFLS